MSVLFRVGSLLNVGIQNVGIQPHAKNVGSLFWCTFKMLLMGLGAYFAPFSAIVEKKAPIESAQERKRNPEAFCPFVGLFLQMGAKYSGYRQVLQECDCLSTRAIKVVSPEWIHPLRVTLMEIPSIHLLTYVVTFNAVVSKSQIIIRIASFCRCLRWFVVTKLHRSGTNDKTTCTQSGTFAERKTIVRVSESRKVNQSSYLSTRAVANLVNLISSFHIHSSLIQTELQSNKHNV